MAADRGMGPEDTKAAEKNFARLTKVATRLPRVEASRAHGWRDNRVNNKALGGVRPDGQYLLVCADYAAKEFLLETQPQTFWQAPHYAGTAWVIVRPGKISDGDLLAVIEATWRTKVTKKLAAEYDAKPPAKSARTPKKSASAKPAAKPSPSRPAKDHFARVVKIASKLPRIEVSTSYGTPSIKANRKFLCRIKEGTDGESLVVITANQDEKEFLLESDPKVFWQTPHYEGHNGLLVHLSKIDDKQLFNLLEADWKRKANKTMLAEYERA
jgi:hypothetical protein